MQISKNVWDAFARENLDSAISTATQARKPQNLELPISYFTRHAYYQLFAGIVMDKRNHIALQSHFHPIIRN